MIRLGHLQEQLVPADDAVHEHVVGLLAGLLRLLPLRNLLIQPGPLLLPLSHLPLRVEQILAVEDLGTGHPQSDVIIGDPSRSRLLQVVRVVQVELAALLLLLIATPVVVEIGVGDPLLLLQFPLLGQDQTLLQLLLLLEQLVA